MNGNTSEKPAGMTDPIPTKFFRSDFDIISDAEKKTGLTRSEIIRRAVRLMGRQKEVVNDYEFLLRLTA